MELPHAPCLGTVITEHRADIEELDQSGVRKEFILQIGSHRRRRIFRTERDAAVPAVRKGVHLLVHHIRSLADASMEQLRMLEHRRADLMVSVKPAKLTDLLFHIIPRGCLFRQDILRAARRICQQRPSSLFPYASSKRSERFSI